TDATWSLGCASGAQHPSGQLGDPDDDHIRGRDRRSAAHGVPPAPWVAGSGVSLAAELLHHPRVHGPVHGDWLLGDHARTLSRAASETASTARPGTYTQATPLEGVARAACTLPVAGCARGGRARSARGCLGHGQ